MLIWMFNLSPETVISGATGNHVDELLEHALNLDYLKDTNTAMMANGARFTRDKKGIFPILVETLFKDRKWNKNEQLRLEAEIEKLKADNGYDRKLVAEMQTKAVQHNAVQMALKILLNSLYGALSNEYFRYFSTDLAEGITLTGQLAIKYTGLNISKFLNEEFETKDINYNIYNDTDSVEGSSIISLADITDMTISDLYNSVTDTPIIRGTDNFIKQVSNDIFAKGVDSSGNLVERRIKHIMKHKVKKEMFKLTVEGKEVICTCDHSLIVKREGKIISVKPREVNPTDVFLYLV